MDNQAIADALVPAKPARKPRTLKKERDKATQLIRQAGDLKPGERKCTGLVRLRPDMKRPAGPDNEYFRNEDGSVQTRPCKNPPIVGGFVCPKHGGKAPQVRKKAEKRLLAMVEPGLIRLEALIQQDEHKPTALGAIRTMLERAGSTSIGPLVKDTGDKDMRPIINIGIKVGGIDKPVVSIGMQAPAAVEESIEGEVIDGDDDPGDE